MGSYTQLNYHVVFGTKYRKRSITPGVTHDLYQYIGGIVRARGGMTLEIGGMADHIHILACLSPAYPVANVIRDIKANSSKWLHEVPKGFATFAWQKGCGAFTVSYSQTEAVRQYICTQAEHHRTRTFKDEYVDLLRRHGIEFRLEHLFEDEHHG